MVRAVAGLALSLGLAACGASRRREVGERVTIIVVPAARPVPVYQGVWPTVMRAPDAGTVEAGVTDVTETRDSTTPW